MPHRCRTSFSAFLTYICVVIHHSTREPYFFDSAIFHASNLRSSAR